MLARKDMKGFWGRNECLPVDVSGIDDAGHAGAWGVADGEGADVAFVGQTVLAKGGVYTGALDVTLCVGDRLSVGYVASEYSYQSVFFGMKYKERP